MSKGRKKPSLRDLSRIRHLDPHWQDIVHELHNQSDRGVALIAAAMADVSLRRLMSCRMIAFKDADEILFDKEGAPLGTFSARIKVARAFGVIGPLAETHLDSVRRIRNQFAHSPLKIDFTNELIAAEIDKLLPDENQRYRPDWSPQRRRYVGTCTLLIITFDTRFRERVHDKLDSWTL